MRKCPAIATVSMFIMSMFGMLYPAPTIVLAQELGPEPPPFEEPPIPEAPSPLAPNSTEPYLPEEIPPDNYTAFSHNLSTPELPEIPLSLPDLKLERVEASYNYTQEGTVVIVTAYLRNAGPYLVNQTTVSFYDNAVSNETLIAVEPCTFEDFSTEVSTEWTSSGQGMHEIIALVDSNNTVEESNESNNDAYVNVKIAPPSEEIPDLMVESGDLRAWDVPSENTSSPINVTIHNTGNGMASDVNVIVRELTTGVPIENYTIPSIEPYSSNTTTVDWFPTYGGLNSLSVSVDEESAIEELRRRGTS